MGFWRSGSSNFAFQWAVMKNGGLGVVNKGTCVFFPLFI